jgi:hypothetical protein
LLLGVENDEVEPPASALHLAECKRGIKHLKIDNAQAVAAKLPHVPRLKIKNSPLEGGEWRGLGD